MQKERRMEMKQVIAAMVGMFFGVVLLGGIWEALLKPLIGGGVEQSFLYPIYGGLILLAGVNAGAAVILYNEIKKLREEIQTISKK